MSKHFSALIDCQPLLVPHCCVLLYCQCYYIALLLMSLRCHCHRYMFICIWKCCGTWNKQIIEVVDITRCTYCSLLDYFYFLHEHNNHIIGSLSRCEYSGEKCLAELTSCWDNMWPLIQYLGGAEWGQYWISVVVLNTLITSGSCCRHLGFPLRREVKGPTTVLNPLKNLL